MGEAGVFVGRSDAVWPGIGKTIHIAPYAADRGEIASQRLRTLIAESLPTRNFFECLRLAAAGEVRRRGLGPGVKEKGREGLSVFSGDL